ncbi:O-antigen ligase domain-containing protein [Acaryochloris sp. IP29b_bin.137]|uniref:O-antigen ligase domain-containing protein n=1 Tax=Acaryochloris sp. IP29b_bin.137 TaxID=2969217 RepID=UPI00262B62C5|nr:O-antigen ligase domain-containing protein [Acaryochloris sp. IP29b_bin.137]
MNLLVLLVMLGWIPFVLYLFKQLPVQRALVLSFIGAWLFLPQVSFPLPGLPDLTKMAATCYGIVLATFIFDAKRFRRFQWSWIDLPMVIWCLCPLASSLTNGLGLYDGLAQALNQTVTWGFPYFLGRLYLGNLGGLKQLAIGMIIGGILYVPLCLLEVRLSPQLHRWIYGYHAHSFEQTMRLGGFRPTVFMEHGLMVGVWMMSATLMAIWLWRAGTLTQLWNISMIWWILALGVTFILVKSTGAYALLLISLVLLFAVSWMRSSLAIWLIAVLMAGYLTVSSTGLLTPTYTRPLIATASQITGPERAASLSFRLQNERLLSAKARVRPVFGWGGWGRARVYDQQGRDISVTDSLWIIAFGNHGLVGLISLMTTLVLPILILVRRIPVGNWTHPAAAPVAALSVAVIIYGLDCLVNAMVNPVFALAAGGLSGLAVKKVNVPRLVRPKRKRPRQIPKT